MPFTYTKFDIQDLILVSPKVFPDGRGYFLETYKESDFKTNGIDYVFVQDNHSRSSQGVLRGLHFQLAPKAQGKLVRVVRGRIWDVVVDIRQSSSTFLKWYGVELSDQNNNMLFVPPGFAHGFVTLSEEADLVYKCTAEYDPDLERGIRFDDPEINISWPIKDPNLSERDLKQPYLSDAKKDIEIIGF